MKSAQPTESQRSSDRHMKFDSVRAWIQLWRTWTLQTSHKHFLLASDFDQTLSFNDSGHVLSELLGVRAFDQKVHGLARSNLVQQGGELAYLIRHDPDFRGVRREHLVETGRRVRLKAAIPALVAFLERGLNEYRFSFCVVSAAPREVVVSALSGIVPADRIYGTDFDYAQKSARYGRSNRCLPGTARLPCSMSWPSASALSLTESFTSAMAAQTFTICCTSTTPMGLPSPSLRTVSWRALRRALYSARTRSASSFRCSIRCWACESMKSDACSNQTGSCSTSGSVLVPIG